MANTIAPHEPAQTDSAMGPMRKGGMRFASASDRVSVRRHAVSTRKVTCGYSLVGNACRMPLGAAERVGGDAAEVVYTSGSTGLPKGVTFSHANLWAGTHPVTSSVGICEHDRVASLLPFKFDMGGSPTQ